MLPNKTIIQNVFLLIYVSVLPTGPTTYHSGNLVKHTERVFRGKEKMFLTINIGKQKCS